MKNKAYSIFLNMSLWLHKLYGTSKSGTSNYVNPIKDLDENLRYGELVAKDYIRLLKKRSKNSSVLEVGTGANLLPAFHLAKHYSKVETIDKYNCLSHDARIYEHVLSDNTEFAKLFNAFIALKSKKLEYNGVCYREIGLEELDNKSKYDIILSRAVFEHLEDAEASVQNLARLLANDGEMIHEIDFRDHGIFTHFGLSPYTMYLINDAIWDKASKKYTGLPNRLTSNDFYKLFRKYFPHHVIDKIVVQSDDMIKREAIRLSGKEKEDLMERVVIFHVYKQ